MLIALVVAMAGCGTLIGIDDRSLDPGGDAGPTGGDSGRNPETGASASGGTDGAATDSSATVDSGPAVADFACGSTPNCRTPNICCIHADFSGGGSSGSGGPPQIEIKDRTCAATCTQSGDFTATLRCAKSADCRAGEVCCFRPATQNSGGSSCETSCAGSFGTFQMCASSADCGGRACDTAFVTPYKSCR